MYNCNPSTLCPYGVIAVSSLSEEIQSRIYEDSIGWDCQELEAAYREAQLEYIITKIDSASLDALTPDHIKRVEQLTDEQIDEIVHLHAPDFAQSFFDGIDEGEFRKYGEIDGIPVSVSSLGGAALLWVLGGPLVGSFRHCSPCVPGAADLDSPCDAGDPGAIQGYDVPREWRRDA